MTGRRKGTPCACETDPCSCGSSKGKCIRTINNLSPDPNGDFFIEAGSGITITQTGDNSFEVSFDGTLPSNPLIYKGTVGSGGTVAVLPAADPDNIGWMYIAIEAATSPVTYEVGDTLISDGYTWQVIPSGDDPVDWSQILNTPTTLAGYGITDAMQADTTPGVWAYTHSGVYQGQTAVAGNAAANSLLARDSDGCGQVADPAADTDSDYAVNVRTLNRRLTDGSVSKIGTINVGSDLKPVKLVAGVPTAVTNDLVSTTEAQTIAGAKTFSDNITISKGSPSMTLKDAIDVTNTTPSGNRYYGIAYQDKNGNASGSLGMGHYTNGAKDAYISIKAENGTNKELHLLALSDGTAYGTIPNRAYNASNTNDVVNISLLDAYTPMVRTTNYQNVLGHKNMTTGLQVATILASEAEQYSTYTWFKVAKLQATKYYRFTYNISLPYNNTNYMIMDFIVITPRTNNADKISVAQMAKVIHNLDNTTEYVGVAYDGTDFNLYIKTGVNTHHCVIGTEATTASVTQNMNSIVTPLTPTPENPTTYTNYVII